MHRSAFPSRPARHCLVAQIWSSQAMVGGGTNIVPSYMTTNINELKNMLLAEKARIEGEMSGIAHKNPEIAGDWEPSAPDLNNPAADMNDVADSIERFEDNAAIEVELEARLVEINAALERIEAGAYGVCRVCGNAVEDARLRANPAAATCIAHRES